MDDLLDQLPLEVLLAMQEALADPSEEGRERARLRALDAGYHVRFLGPDAEVGRPDDPLAHEPIEMEAAPEGVESLVLRFDR